MSLLKANSVQIGQSATATNNFTLSVPASPDGTIKLARGNSGATTADVLTVNASGAITGATISGATINSSTINGGSITLGTAQNSTSGTAIDFTGIPSWAKRVTVMFNGVSTNGTSRIQVQLGDGSIKTSGYITQSCYVSVAAVANERYTSGFIVVNAVQAAGSYGGVARFHLLGSNIWCGDSSLAYNDATNTANYFSSGNVTLSSSLDRLRITTVNGTDTFDAGSINIMYEG